MLHPTPPPTTPLPAARGGGGLLARARAAWGRTGSIGRGLAQGGAWNAVGFLAHAAVMFALSPFIVVRLGLDAYGAWEVIIALTGYLGFADLGVAAATVHWVARGVGQGRTDAVNATVNTSFLVCSAAGGLILGVAALLAGTFASWFHVAPGFAEEARTAFLVTAAGIGLSLPLNAFSAVLVAKLRYDALVATDVVFLLARTAVLVALLERGDGLVAIACANGATELAKILVKAALAFRAEPALRFRPRMATRADARRLLAYGGGALGVSVALQLVWASGAIVISATLSAAAVGLFAVGSKLALYARDFFRVFGRALEPASASLDARGERGTLAALLGRASRTLLLLYGPILLFFLVYGEAFLARWMGDATFRGESAAVLRILAIAVAAPIASYPFVAAMYGLNLLRVLAGLVLLEGVLNLSLSILLAGPLGIVGVAAGTAVPAVLVHVLLVPRVLAARLGAATRNAALRAWIPLALGVAVGVLLLSWVAPPSASYSWAALAGLAAACVAVFGATAWGLLRLVVPHAAARPAAARGEAAA